MHGAYGDGKGWEDGRRKPVLLSKEGKLKWEMMYCICFASVMWMLDDHAPSVWCWFMNNHPSPSNAAGAGYQGTSLLAGLEEDDWDKNGCTGTPAGNVSVSERKREREREKKTSTWRYMGTKPVLFQPVDIGLHRFLYTVAVEPAHDTYMMGHQRALEAPFCCLAAPGRLGRRKLRCRICPWTNMFPMWSYWRNTVLVAVDCWAAIDWAVEGSDVSWNASFLQLKVQDQSIKI